MTARLLRVLGDVVIALAELARARLLLPRFNPSHAIVSPLPESVSAAHQREMIERVALAIGRAACRVPFRSDCLVQALAAQHWLARNGVSSEIRIGARKDAATRFHAWLVAGGKVVVGGKDTEGFVHLSVHAGNP